jgi:hypothetical protein
MKRTPLEVIAALQAVGLQVQRRNTIAYVTRRPGNGRIRTQRATPTRTTNAANLMGPGNMVAVTTVHLQANPYHLKHEVISSVRDTVLRGFMKSVLNNPMVESAMTTAIGKGYMNALYPIQFIQKAAHLCSNAQIRTPQFKDLVFVATVIRGLTSSAGKGSCRPLHQDCLRRDLLPAFSDLREASFAVGFTLEQLLQWGDDVERDELLDDTRKQMDDFLGKSQAQWEAQA